MAHGEEMGTINHVSSPFRCPPKLHIKLVTQVLLFLVAEDIGGMVLLV